MKKCKFCKQEIDDKAKICPHCRKIQSSGCLKTIIIVFLVLILIPILISSCINYSKKKSDDSSKEVEVSTKKSNEDSSEDTSDSDNSDVANIIYDQNGIVVTFMGMEEGAIGAEIQLLVENNSDKNYCVQSRDFSVNGYMIDVLFSADVAPGKKANDSITVLNSYLEKNGLDYDSINDIEFSLHIFDSDDWMNSFDSGIISMSVK